MSRRDTILRAAKRTAKEARAAASSRRERSRGGIGVDPHRHCVVCWTPVHLEEDPAVCGREECLNIHKKRGCQVTRLGSVEKNGSVASIVKSLIVPKL